MIKVFLLAIAFCMLNVSCKKDKHLNYYKAVILQGTNYCKKGTWVKLEKAMPVPSSGPSDTFNVINLPDAYNVPGKQVEITFDFEQPEVCVASGLNYPSVRLTYIK